MVAVDSRDLVSAADTATEIDVSRRKHTGNIAKHMAEHPERIPAHLRTAISIDYSPPGLDFFLCSFFSARRGIFNRPAGKAGGGGR